MAMSVRAFRAAAIGLLHVPPVSLLFIETRRADWIACAVSYLVILFALGAGLHRYFAHRAFVANRGVQFGLAVLGAAFFADPIGFTGRHRLHHRYSDTERDFHGPRRGLWFSWIGHLLEDGYEESELLAAAADLARYPELMWLHRHAYVPGLTTMVGMFVLDGYSALAAGYCLPWCLVAIHGSSAVNYFCHKTGRRRYDTGDRSTNNLFLGLVLLGEGWHNNHHHYPAAARAGFFWHEPDGLYYVLKLLAWIGIVRELREVPDAVREARLLRGKEVAGLVPP
jgi:stearoyl-CoA desaturase (delta-9 desaturase)